MAHFNPILLLRFIYKTNKQTNNFIGLSLQLTAIILQLTSSLK